MESGDHKAIRQVIEHAYIRGIHGNQEQETVKRGFHHDFVMMVKTPQGMEKVTLDQWLERIEVMKADNPEMWASKTRHEFLSIDVTGHTAMAKLEVLKGGVHFSTDYMFLYKFGDAWKIVSKVFEIPS